MTQQQYEADWSQMWQPEEPDGSTAVLERPPATAEGDRVGVHLAWEVLLLGAVLVFVVLVFVLGSEPGRLAELAVLLTSLTLTATGLALSLRAAVPNLAVAVAPAAAAGLAAYLHLDRGLSVPRAVLETLGVAAGVGLLLGLFVVVFNVPAWVASLGAAALALGVPAFVLDAAPRAVTGGGFDTQPWLVYAGIAGASVLGGLVCVAPGMRRWLGARREAHNARPGARAGLAALLALTASTVLAAGGGIAALIPPGAPQATTPAAGLLVLGAVLSGGVSVLGRRGGVFGTVLGVALLVLIGRYLVQVGVLDQVVAMLPGIAVMVGLVVNRLLERAGHRPLRG